jgi:hypothetical protein
MPRPAGFPNPTAERTIDAFDLVQGHFRAASIPFTKIHHAPLQLSVEYRRYLHRARKLPEAHQIPLIAEYRIPGTASGFQMKEKVGDGFVERNVCIRP